MLFAISYCLFDASPFTAVSPPAALQVVVSTLLSKLESNNGSHWSLMVRVNDGSASMDVDLSNQVSGRQSTCGMRPFRSYGSFDFMLASSQLPHYFISGVLLLITCSGSRDCIPGKSQG